MEDAVDALKMAFSVLIFVIGLAIVFNMFALAREASDIVIAKTDNTYFDQYAFADEEKTGGREVGIETIIPTLYRYYIEKSEIDINNTDNTIMEKFDEETERLVYTRVEGYNTSEYMNDLYPDGIPWLANPTVDTQTRVTSYIEGKNNVVNGIELGKYDDQNKNLKDLRNKTFIETFEQEHNGDKTYIGEDGSTIYLVRGTTKLHITYKVSK